VGGAPRFVLGRSSAEDSRSAAFARSADLGKVVDTFVTGRAGGGGDLGQRGEQGAAVDAVDVTFRGSGSRWLEWPLRWT